jgi:hypothetical protein
MTSNKRLSTEEIDFSDEDSDGYEDDWSSAAKEGYMDPEIVNQIKADMISEGIPSKEADEIIKRMKKVTDQISNDIQNQGD